MDKNIDKLLQEVENRLYDAAYNFQNYLEEHEAEDLFKIVEYVRYLMNKDNQVQ